MPQYEPPEHPVHILHREGRHASVKARAFIDLLAEQLRGDRTLNPGSAGDRIDWRRKK
jgi:DNA-binding transcriptional LysR family regulator